MVDPSPQADGNGQNSSNTGEVTANEPRADPARAGALPAAQQPA